MKINRLDNIRNALLSTEKIMKEKEFEEYLAKVKKFEESNIMQEVFKGVVEIEYEGDCDCINYDLYLKWVSEYYQNVVEKYVKQNLTIFELKQALDKCKDDDIYTIEEFKKLLNTYNLYEDIIYFGGERLK